MRWVLRVNWERFGLFEGFRGRGRGEDVKSGEISTCQLPVPDTVSRPHK